MSSADHCILVVDDDDELRPVLQQILVHSGYRVYTARNGLEALGAVHELKPCLIVLDLMMPVMDGWQFLAELESSRGSDRPKVMVLTAAGDDLPRCYPTYFKPIGLQAFVAAVQQYCPPKPKPKPQLLH